MLLSTQNAKEFLNETNILKKINHPNIIKYYDGFTNKHTFYLILEYAEFGDLRKVIDEHKRNNIMFKQDEILFYVHQIAKSISYIHSKNILHRDIKPENIFICKDNVVKLGDFGISKELSASINFTTTGLGTPYYVSPEICKGEKYNHKSDIWAFGCLIYEMLTLKRPFNYSNIVTLIYNIVNNPPASVSDNGLYCKELIKMVEDMLNKHWEKRPSISEVCAIIDNVMTSNNNNNTEQNANTPLSSFVNKTTSSSNGITLLNVLNIKPMNFMNFTNTQNESKSPQKTNCTSNRTLHSNSAIPNANANYNGHQLKLLNNNNNGQHPHHFSNNHVKLTTQGGTVRNQSVPKKAHDKGERPSQHYEIQKKKTEDFQRKLKRRFFSQETSDKKGSNVNQEQRKHLIRNHLENKYGKEMLMKIEACVQQDMALLSNLIGEGEYLKYKKYFKYLSNI